MRKLQFHRGAIHYVRPADLFGAAGRETLWSWLDGEIPMA
jgi:hypothetical protein